MTDSAKGGERKRQVLRLLEQRGPLTSASLADRLPITDSTVRDMLARGQRRGYVEKEGGEFRPGRGSTRAEYDITDRGQRHLDYLMRNRDRDAARE